MDMLATQENAIIIQLTLPLKFFVSSLTLHGAQPCEGSLLILVVLDD